MSVLDSTINNPTNYTFNQETYGNFKRHKRWGNMRHRPDFSRPPKVHYVSGGSSFHQHEKMHHYWKNRAITEVTIIAKRQTGWRVTGYNTTLKTCCAEVIALWPHASQIFCGGQPNKSAEWLFLCGPWSICFYLRYLTIVSLMDAGSKKEEVW